MTNKDEKAITVNSFTPRFKSDNPFEQPSAGKECVVVKMSLSNGSATEWSVPLTEVAVVDSNGQKYDTAICGPGNDHISGLVAGGHGAATLAFEVPAGTALNLTWTPNSFETTVYETHLR